MVVGGERRATLLRTRPSYLGMTPPLSLVYARPAPGFEPREVEKEKPLRLHPNMGVGGGARFTSVGGYVVNYVTQNKPPPPSPLRARAEGAIETSPGARTRALASHTPEM